MEHRVELPCPLCDERVRAPVPFPGARILVGRAALALHLEESHALDKGEAADWVLGLEWVGPDTPVALG